MNLFQIFFLLISIFSIFSLTRQRGALWVNYKQSLAWIAILITSLIVVLFPQVSLWLAGIFGIQRGADFIIYISIIALFYLSFLYYLKLNETDKKLKELSTKIALSNYKKNEKK